MILYSKISWGHLELLEIFFKANNLDVTCLMNTIKSLPQVDFYYEDDSDTAMTLTFMGVRHLGIENMLCDYLINCGVPRFNIAGGGSSGNRPVKRDMKKLDQEWEEHKKKIKLW